MKKVMMTVIAGILFPLLLVPVQGQEKEIKKTEQLSPDEKKAEQIGHTPAIVSVITAEDIRKMGTTSLYEVLSYVPGIDVTETYFGHTSVSVRGNLQTHYNNKTLLLINNHPLYESVNGSFYLEQIPLNLIKRIEIIRDPGSTLYGTNAYAGVIKIITWEGADLKGGTANAQYGIFSSLDGGLVLGGKSGDFQFSAGTTVTDSKGYDYRVKTDEDGRSQTIKYKNDFANVMGSVSYRGLSLNFGYFHNTKDKFGLVPTLVSSGEKVQRGFFLDASWQCQVAAKMSMKLLTYYDSLDMNADIGWYPPSYALQQAGIGEHEKAESSGAKMGVDLRASYAPASGFNLVGGLAYEYQKTDPYTFLNFDTGAISSFQSSPWLENHSTYDFSGYFQLDARLSEKWGLVGGLRYNYNQDYGLRVQTS